MSTPTLPPLPFQANTPQQLFIQDALASYEKKDWKNLNADLKSLSQTKGIPENIVQDFQKCLNSGGYNGSPSPIPEDLQTLYTTSPYNYGWEGICTNIADLFLSGKMNHIALAKELLKMDAGWAPFNAYDNKALTAAYNFLEQSPQTQETYDQVAKYLQEAVSNYIAPS